MSLKDKQRLNNTVDRSETEEKENREETSINSRFRRNNGLPILMYGDAVRQLLRRK